MTLPVDRKERALEVVVEEARREAPRELSPEFEERLFAALAERGSGPARVQSARLLPRVLAVAALVAAALGYALWREPAPSPSPVVAARVESPTLDGDELERPELIAGDEAVEVLHQGRARWWLEPGSRALVRETRGRIRISLESGALRADVVPSKEHERFVVEAGGARVAVRGTVFRVALEGGDSVVEVTEGTVAVRALNDVSSEPVLLRSPARAVFGHGSNGAKVAAKGEGRGAVRKRGLEQPVTSVPSRTPLELPPVVDSTPPDQLTKTDVDALVTSVLEAVTRCFTEHTVASHGVRVHVRSSLTLAVAPDGSVTNALFSPPLSPPVHACSERAVLALSSAPSQKGLTVTRIIELSR